MKKMALAATLLAVFMMGCSDMGVDNSVASTSEAKIGKTEPLLAKIATSPIIIEPLSPGMEGVGNGYQYYPYENLGIGVAMQTRVDLDWDGYEAQGEYYVADGSNPNTILVVTILVSDCKLHRYYQNPNVIAECKWDNIGVEYKVNQNIRSVLAHSPRNPQGKKLSSNKVATDIGAVSAFVGIWNQGTPIEVVHKAATYNGELFKKENGHEWAQAVYDTYIKDKICEVLGRCL